MAKISITQIVRQYNVEDSVLEVLYYQELIPLEVNSGEYLLEDSFESELEWILRMHSRHGIPMKSMDLIYYMYCKNRELQQRLNDLI